MDYEDRDRGYRRTIDARHSDRRPRKTAHSTCGRSLKDTVRRREADGDVAFYSQNKAWED